MATIVTMKSGAKHLIRGYAGQVAKEIENGVENAMPLIPLEIDTLPTKQMMYVNPSLVESVKEDGF